MRFFYFMLFMVLASCVSKKQNDVIVIKGIIKNLPANKVYLTDAFKWQIFLDSADYKNDTFCFHISSKNFRPYLASIYYIDSNGKRQVLIYQNYMLSNKYGETAFVLSKGITRISGTFINSKDKKLIIAGNRQNDPFFKTELTDFGWINTKNNVKRKEIITSYKKLIKQYPDSYYFIKTLYDYRSQYSKDEITDMLNLFKNTDITDYFKQEFTIYFKELPSRDVPLHNYTFKNPLNQTKNIIDTSAKLNILIFWASWCGPCRLEIPQLKQIYNEFKNNNGLHMVSISIDENTETWKSALRAENMDWEQLIADNSLLEEVKNSFNFDAIPLVVFTNGRGLEIARSTDYKPENKDQFEGIIKKYLND